MKVILHNGAHRTGTTSLQAYMRRNANELGDLGVGFWGPNRTRKGLFSGFQPMPGQGLNAARRARGRIMLQLEKAAQNGVKTLLISDENLMESVRLNLRTGQLYPDVGARLARYICGFDGAVDKVVMSVRSLDRYWASAMAYGVGRGHNLATGGCRNRIARGARSWRDVIADVSCATHKSKIEVIPFEVAAGRVDGFASVCLEHGVPSDGAGEWLNRAPDSEHLRNLLIQRGDDAGDMPDVQERWNPFDTSACAAMRETYADDMHWLVAGANGLATLTEKLDPTRVRQTLPHGSRNRGQGHDKQERRVAHPR